MILDSSAIVAIICAEPGWQSLVHKLALARTIVVGAPTVAETQMVLAIKLGPNGAAKSDQLLAELQATIVPFARNHVSIFYEAFQRYGKGHHPARLNMGDCFTYAIAKASGMPVLFVGDDFSQTDLTPA